MLELAHNLGVSLSSLLDTPIHHIHLWNEYFEKSPPGWREDHRFGLVLQSVAAFGDGKLDPAKYFPTLKKIKESNETRKGPKGLLGSSLFQRLMNAKGGDDLPWMNESKEIAKEIVKDLTSED